MWRIVALAQLGRQVLMFDKLIQGKKKGESMVKPWVCMVLYHSPQCEHPCYPGPFLAKLQIPCRNLTFSTFVTTSDCLESLVEGS
jgi:hypothetical protein